MMASHSEAEEDQFFDTHVDIASVSDLDSDFSEDSYTTARLFDGVSNGFSYEFWTRTPESVHQRRSKFLEHMGLSLDQKEMEKEKAGDMSFKEIKMEIERINHDNGAVLRNSSFEDLFLCRGSSISMSSSTDEEELFGDYAFEENFVCAPKNLDIGTDFIMDGVGKNKFFSRLREVGSNKLVKNEKPRKIGNNNVNSWLSKLRSKVHTIDRQGEANSKSSSFNSKEGAPLRKTRVRTYKKRLKELSCLYEGQEFRAHEGSISVMRFSPDGQFLASAGEDGVVRVWKVIEDERENNLDIQDIDPSCLYFSVNHYSKLAPLDFHKDKKGKMRKLKKSTKPGCVIFPPKVFGITQKPIHEFCGHCGEILSLSWSSNECLLSSSVDKTVRLWQLGQDKCLKVFSHNNYVTCVEFNPLDDNYFISGSIDGKIRIWEVSGCQVVDWIDIREIVTAVCYYPSGKGGIVGSMDGSCHFYDIIDNQLQLDAQINLQGKKKLPCKRITGFQFSPGDPRKVIVTSADSQVRVLCGIDVIFKLKGPRMPGNQVTASFTADGKHIISGSEDFNIHVWDYASNNGNPSKAKNIYARESFVSHNSSIAIPWCGMKKTKTEPLSSPSVGNDLICSILGKEPCNHDLLEAMPSSSPDCFSLGRGLFIDSWPKGPATWPEENLSAVPTMCRSDYKFLKSTFENMCDSHMWGLVIVTAGRDGRIRTYHNYGLPVHL